jgi:hypothetical protein
MAKDALETKRFRVREVLAHPRIAEPSQDDGDDCSDGREDRAEVQPIWRRSLQRVKQSRLSY